MRRKWLVAGLAGSAVLVGIVIFVVLDIKAAKTEIDASITEINEIGEGASRTSNVAQLRSYVMQLDGVTYRLAGVTHRHPLAAWFGDLGFDLSRAQTRSIDVGDTLTKRTKGLL